MSERDDGGPAFPIPSIYDGNGCGIQEGSSGMMLRDWFAGQALGSIPLRSWDHLNGDATIIQTWAKCAYAVADAMIAERSKMTPTP